MKSTIMKTTTGLIAVLLISLGALVANENAPAPAGAPVANEEAPKEALTGAKAHIATFLRADHQGLEGTYAPTVVLLPGHEFLKVEYGLTDVPGRAKETAVKRADLIRVMTKAAKGRGERSAEQVAAAIKSMEFEVLKTAVGDYAIAPADPVQTPDGKLHFTIEPEDVLLKIGPPKGDFILLQLREMEGTWRVVAEYLD